jgi:glycosyltransferase involved in cell wall biosynthesis
MARVSVVMAVHNGEAYIAEAIESVLRQTYSDLEVIVVDDGSDDGTSGILRTLESSDSRVVAIRPGRIGFADALNVGIEYSRGEYIARMDADDVCFPTRINRQVNFMDSNPQMAASGCSIEVFQDQHITLVRFPCSPHAIRTHLLFYCALSHPTVVVRRSALHDLGIPYRSEFDGAADYDLWCRMDRSGWQLANLPDVLLRYRRHAAQITTKDGCRQGVIADRVRLHQLSHYGLEASPKELEIHFALARWEHKDAAGSLDEVGDWLERIESRLSRIGGFSMDDLRPLLETHWYAACRFNGEPGWRRCWYYGTSRYGRTRPLAMVRLAARIALDSMASTDGCSRRPAP